jgi:hypothetical protein
VSVLVFRISERDRGEKSIGKVASIAIQSLFLVLANLSHFKFQSSTGSNSRSKTMSQTTQTLGLGLGAVLLATAAWFYGDYRAWINFGTGGTPPNIQGYIKISKLRLLCAFFGDDPKDSSSLSSDGPSYLQIDLPPRSGQRPKIMPRTLPQRQYPAPLDKKASQRLHDIPKKYAESFGDIADFDKSITEGRTTDAIYGKPDRTCGAHDGVLGNEIAHVHPQDNSLHVWLTQADGKKVVSAGWGERFPLSSLGMCDAGWTFVYAPRNMDEVSIVEEIVKAGIGHLSGKRV